MRHGPSLAAVRSFLHNSPLIAAGVPPEFRALRSPRRRWQGYGVRGPLGLVLRVDRREQGPVGLKLPGLGGARPICPGLRQTW